MSKSLADLAYGVRERAIQTLAYANAQGIGVIVTSTRRSRAEQRRLRDRYEEAVADGSFGKPGGLQYPANSPGDSAHQYGLAFDSVTVRPDQADAWIEIRKQFGWDVPNNDPVHAGVPFWRPVLAYLRAHGVDP